MLGTGLKKQCTKCGKVLPATTKYFNCSKQGKYGLKSRCKKCLREYRQKNKRKMYEYGKEYEKKERVKERRKKYRLTHKKQQRNYMLQRRYGITLKDYNKILKSQKYCCAICGKHQSNFKRALDIDHSHKTGHIRGLLCNYCNHRLLGYLRDSKKRAKGLIKYLVMALEQDKNWKD